MATKKLAKKLGLLRQRSKSCSESKKPVISDQIFSYLIVIDFESTCWREKTNYPQEIIEFPAVLLNTSTGEVESEFHTYVQPQEHPVLSEFCTELTGITQMQVETGIPLQICLSQFNRWLQNLQLKQGVTFPNNQQTCSASSSSQKLCTFLTWSVCLQYECKRKQLHKPEVLNSWIDLRSTYRLFYNRKPKGLNGALQDLGIQFSGREHSGLDDARNTAQLAVRMMRDGCVMVITRSLERNPVMVKPKFGNHVHPAENKKDTLNIHGRQNVLSPHELTSSKIPLRDFKKPSSPEAFPTDLDIKENSSSVQSCKSLISPKTLLSVTAAPPWGQTCGSDTARPAARPSSTVTVNSSHVLCSTTISCFSNPPQSKQVLQTDLLDEEEDAGLLVETEDRCGSYDNMVLECDDAIRDLDAEYVSDFDSGSYEREESDYLHPSEGNVGLDLRGSVRTRNNHRIQNITSDSLIACKSINTVKSISNGFSYKVEMMQQSTASSSAACFAVPKAVNWSKLKQRQITSPQLQPNLGGNHKNDQTIMTPPIRSKSFFPEKTSTPNISSARLKPFITKHTEPQKSSFNIFTEMKNQTTESFHHSSSGSGRIPNNILSSLSANTSTSRVNPSRVSWPLKGLQKITSPLCACGRRSKRQVVSNGGPNHGRGFFCCPVRRSGGRGTVQKGCDFFKWESVLMKNSAVAACAERSSISICQNNSTLHHKGPPRKSYSSVGDAATVIRL